MVPHSALDMAALLLLLALLAPVQPLGARFGSGSQNITRFAAFAIVEGGSSSLEAVPGQVKKHAQPVFTMEQPWEMDVNNGYSSVLYDPENSFGLGQFRAFYSASDGGFGTADCPPHECPGGSATLVANSSDGLVWEKPKLGLFAWSNSSKNRGMLSNATTPHACCIYCPAGLCPCPYCGTAMANETNILFQSTTAVAIFDDSAHDTNTSRRFKVWGNLAQQMIATPRRDVPVATETRGACDTCFTEHGCKPHGTGCDACVAGIKSCKTTCHPPFSKMTRSAFCQDNLPWKAPQVAGVAVSADGQTWTDYKNLQTTTDPRPNRWRFDAQAAMFFDERRQKYVGTNRAFRPCQRSEMPGGEAEACGMCPIWWQPHGGCQDPPRPGCSATQCNHVCVQSLRPADAPCVLAPVRSSLVPTDTGGSAFWLTDRRCELLARSPAAVLTGRRQSGGTISKSSHQFLA